VDAEKTYSGLTDGCAAAGAAGCKLIQLTGDNVSGDVVKTLLNDVHDVIVSFLGLFIQLTLLHFSCSSRCIAGGLTLVPLLPVT